MFERKYLTEIQKRLEEKRKFIQIILGPRQVGKTTIATQLCDKLEIQSVFISADGVLSSNLTWIDQQWEAVRLKLKSGNNTELLLVIDEIQKIQNWDESIKKNWDLDSRNNTNIKVLLLGSSNILIQKCLTESLTGRFEVTYLPHWSMTEMKEAFGVVPEEFVFFGSYPGSAELFSDEKRWKDYIKYSIIETTISKDILQLTSVQKPALLKNLFELGCKYAGEILSYTKMLGQLHDAGNTTTLAHYQALLDKSWMISGLQKFSGSQISIRSSIPKWIAYNNALTSVYSEIGFNNEQISTENWGRRVEQAIGAHLINNARTNDFELFYWREGNSEVDFVLLKQKKIIALEVKTGKVKFHKGIENFGNKYEVFKNILISNESLTWKEFLSLDVNLLFE